MGIAIGEDGQRVAALQPLQPRQGVGEGGQLRPGIHQVPDRLGGGLDAVQAQGVDQGAAHGLQVAAVTEHQEGVLELLDALARAPLVPEAVRRGGRLLVFQERGDKGLQAAAQVQYGAEQIKCERANAGVDGHYGFLLYLSI